MKNNSYLLLILVFLFSLTQACKSDDEGNGNGQNEEETFDNTCCKVPHLEACVGGAKVYVPNAFTPDSDGFNDIFTIFGGQGLSEVVSFKVLKSDGTIVHESMNFSPNDHSFGWDGLLPDGTIQLDVYDYEISIKNIAEEIFSFEGKVCCRTTGADNFPCVDLEKNCAYSTQHDGNGGFDPAVPNFETCQ